ncbi:MAG: hypothetical protein ABI702_15240 [Burkholderiales bacterium]
MNASLVFKTDKPDHETFTTNFRGQPEEKDWTYLPTPRDAQTLTIVTLQAGVVLAVQRNTERQRARHYRVALLQANAVTVLLCL